MNPIINIQFLRAVAAIAVLIYHFSIQYMITNEGEMNAFFQFFNLIGYAGVDFFFVISGYIMWMTTRKSSTSKPVAQFAYKRFTRIYLGYWPYFLLAIVIISIFPHLAPKAVNLSGSFWLTELHTNKLLIQVAWTLQYELYFYFLFALIMLLPNHRQMIAIIGCVVAVIGFSIVKATNTDFELTILNFMFSPFCLQFFAGCLIGVYFEKRRINFKWSLGLGILLLVFAVYYQTNIINQSLVSHSFAYQRIAIYGLAAVLIMATMVELELRGHQLFKKTSIILGGSSYSIYLSHTLAIALIYALGWQTWVQQNSQSPGWWIGLFMLLTIIYSVAHYLWVEKPIMSLANMLRKKLFR